MTPLSPDAPAARPSDLSVFASDPPELRGHADALDVAYDEYERRTATGEAVSVSAFVAEYPAELQEPLSRVLAAHELLRSRGYTADAPNEFAWPEIGETVEGLEVRHELGRGGFGRVYLAWDKNINRHDVLKVTVGSTEAKLAGPLAHPYIVPILSAPTLPGGASCIRMPLLGCATLQDVLADAFPAPGAAPASADVFRAAGRKRAERANLPVPPAAPADGRTYSAASLAVAVRLADGVAFLHRKGIRHRDLKPSNVLIDWDGQPVILDFNLAERAAIDLPRLGGTLPFMAPEQIQTMLGVPLVGPFDDKADVFSLGVLLYQLFSGQHPFGVPPERWCTRTRQKDSRGFAAWLLGQQRSGCAALNEFAPDLDRTLAELVHQCLAFDPRNRPTSEAVAKTLAAIADQSRAPRRRWSRTRWALVGFACFAVVALGILGAANRGAADPDRVVARAKAEVNRGRPEKAEALIDDMVRREKANANAFFVRGVARLRQKEHVSAASDFEKAYEQGGDPRALECLTYCYGEVGAYSMCIFRANQAESAGHLTATLLTNRAFATLFTAPTDFDGREAAGRSARVDLDQAKRLDPSHQGAHFISAFLIVRRCLESRKFDELATAQEELDRAIACGPPAPDLFYYAALVRAHDSNKTPQTEAEIVGFIGQALAHGGDPAQFTLEPPFRFMRNNPAFKAAVKVPPGPKPDHDLYWSNPVAGMLE